MLYMVTFTINIPQMLANIYHTWILWEMESWGQRLDEDGHSNGHVDVIPASLTAIWKFNQLTGLVLTAHFFGIKKRIKGLLMIIFPGLSGLVTLYQPVIDSPTGE